MRLLFGRRRCYRSLIQIVCYFVFVLRYMCIKLNISCSRSRYFFDLSCVLTKSVIPTVECVSILSKIKIFKFYSLARCVGRIKRTCIYFYCCKIRMLSAVYNVISNSIFFSYEFGDNNLLYEDFIASCAV